MGVVAAKGLNEMQHVQREPTELKFNRIKARVDKVHINGLQRTKDDYVVGNVDDLFRSQTFEQVLVNTQKVRGELERLGCFNSIGIFIDVSSGKDATPEGLEVTFNVREQKRLGGGISTVVGENEGGLVLSLRMPNILGRGERLHAEYSYSSRKTSGFQLTTSKPLLMIGKPIVNFSLFQRSFDTPASGFGQVNRGLLCDVAFKSYSNFMHNVQWDATWRELNCLSKATAFEVREQAGHSLKSALRHIFSYDSRDSQVLPNVGMLFKLTNELAGLGGDISTTKHEGEVQLNVPIFNDLIFQVALQGGIIRPLDSSKDVSICDRFFLGGPLNLRGFETRGVGPIKDGNSLGAQGYWSGALHLYTPLPFRPGKGGFGELFRSHFFLNAGNIGNCQLSEDMSINTAALTNDMRVVYGFGVAMRLGHVARIELNYCVPVSVQKGDKTNPGLQVGVGVSFL